MPPSWRLSDGSVSNRAWKWLAAVGLFHYLLYTYPGGIGNMSRGVVIYKMPVPGGEKKFVQGGGTK